MNIILTKTGALVKGRSDRSKRHCRRSSISRRQSFTFSMLSDKIRCPCKEICKEILESLLKTRHCDSVQELVESVVNEWRAFSKGMKQSDDKTILALQI